VKRLGLWKSKNYQRDAQKNKISLELSTHLLIPAFYCQIKSYREIEDSAELIKISLNSCLPEDRFCSNCAAVEKMIHATH